MALADSIHRLSGASRRVRTAMWNGLQATVLFNFDPKLASGEKGLDDNQVLNGKKEGDIEEAKSDQEEPENGDATSAGEEIGEKLS